MTTLRVLGACSGTEPMKDLHHTSLVLTVNGANYFFDAGENCAHTAHLCGVDLLKTAAVFISHTHYDHVGGLAGLFWTINKLNTRYKKPLLRDNIPLFIPEIAAWEHILGMLTYTEGNFRANFTITPDVPHLGRFYTDENICVTAFPSKHLPPHESGTPRALSYLITAKGKRIVYSGDIKQIEELTPLTAQGCDLLIAETGHHTVASVCSFAEAQNVGKLMLVHHGREILENRPTATKALAACRVPTVVATDGTTLEWEETI